MVNDHVLKPGYRCYMFSGKTISDQNLGWIRGLWNKLMEYEMSILLQQRTVAALFEEELKKSKEEGYMHQKFHEFCTDVTFFYLITHVDMPIAFMAVRNNSVLALYVEHQWRNEHLGKFLLQNHIEIFNEFVEVQCYRDNRNALEFYKNMDFEITAESGIYYRLRKDV